jgi:hypothetical protein
MIEKEARQSLFFNDYFSESQKRVSKDNHLRLEFLSLQG